MRTAWLLVWLPWILIPGLLAVVVALVAGAPSLVSIALLVVTLVSAAVAIVGVHAVWRRWGYVVTADATELHHGVVSHRMSVIPYHRIQQIDLQRGPIQRGLGLTTVILRTASATSDGTIPGLLAPDAEGLRHWLVRRAGIDDAV